MEETNLQSRIRCEDKPAESVWQTPGFWLILAFFFVSVAGNFFGAIYFSQNSSFNAWAGFDLCAAIGLLFAQACLIAIWLTLGSQHALVRICLSLGTLLALVCIYVLSLDFADSGRLPAEVSVFIAGIAFTFVGLISIPLALMRWRSRRLISRKVASSDVASQFGIRHLFTATAIVAVLTPLVQLTFSNSNESFLIGAPPWVEFLCFAAIYVLLSSLACLLSLAWVFDEKRRVIALALLAGVILLAPQIGTWILAVQFPSVQNNSNVFAKYAMAYTASLSMGLVVALTIVYLFGYRLQKA